MFKERRIIHPIRARNIDGQHREQFKKSAYQQEAAVSQPLAHKLK